jgi:hypothetical protein
MGAFAAICVYCVACLPAIAEGTEAPTVDALLEKATPLRGEEYVAVRDAIVQAANDEGVLKKLEEVAGDEKTPVARRLLARICVLRRKELETVTDFETAVAKSVRALFSTNRVFIKRLGVQEYLARGNPLHFFRATARDLTIWEIELRPLAGRHELALFAECPLWHTEASLKASLHLDWREDEGTPAEIILSQASNRTAGYAAKILASQLLVASSDPVAVWVIEEWGRREPGHPLDGWRYKCIEAMATWEESSAAARKEAIAALGRAGTDQHTVNVLTLLSRDKNPEIKKAAEEALQKTKEK